jgi:hypothetical protein
MVEVSKGVQIFWLDLWSGRLENESERAHSCFCNFLTGGK